MCGILKIKDFNISCLFYIYVKKEVIDIFRYVIVVNIGM